MSGRLSTLAAAMVIARRDFYAVLLSRSFFFFLLGPLFPVIVGVLAGGVGQRVQESSDPSRLGVAMASADVEAMQAARNSLAEQLGASVPELVVVKRLDAGEHFDPAAALKADSGGVAAIVSGTLAQPLLTGAAGAIHNWQGPVSIIIAQAARNGPDHYPAVAVNALASATPASERGSQLVTAQAAQTLLFLLTMLLAGMVLSNLVEEKANKIIEILAAAIPMDAVFFGKLFAMLAVSLVGIGVWAICGGVIFLTAGSAIPQLPAPAVGWPLFLGLGVIYFAAAYLLLGSVFLAIGSLANTVREVQTLSMPVTMMQLMVFFLASYAMTQPGSMTEVLVAIFPFSSPFAMLARAAQDAALWPHAAAIAWQVFCIVILVRFGARLFRSRVMKSGPAKLGKSRRSWFGKDRATTG